MVQNENCCLDILAELLYIEAQGWEPDISGVRDKYLSCTKVWKNRV